MIRTMKWFVTLAVTAAVSPVAAQTVEYMHTDALGSVVAITDTSGAVVERNQFEPYGSDLTGIKDGPGFTGHVSDAVTGLSYMQQRYYDPQIGQFLSVDPVTPYSNPVAHYIDFGMPMGTHTNLWTQTADAPRPGLRRHVNLAAWEQGLRLKRAGLGTRGRKRLIRSSGQWRGGWNREREGTSSRMSMLRLATSEIASQRLGHFYSSSLVR